MIPSYNREPPVRIGASPMTSRTRVGCLPIYLDDGAVLSWKAWSGSDILGVGYLNVTDDKGRSVCELIFRDKQSLKALHTALGRALEGAGE